MRPPRRRSGSSTPLRLLIADDRPLVREGLISALRRERGIFVDGIASDLRAASSFCLRHRPHLAIVGQGLPPGGGVDAIPSLLETFPLLRVVLLMSSEGEEDLFRAIRFGARGCLLRTASLRDTVRVLRSVHAGNIDIPVSATPRLAQRMNARELTPKEAEVLRRMVAGRSNKEIGGDLGIVEGTVKIHVRKILSKLDVRSRVQAVSTALRQGLVTEFADRT
jgi:two-component system, NarL family, response regulator